MSTVWGTPITRSMHQLTAASTRGEPTAAAIPTSTATTALMREATVPTVRLMDRPLKVRASRSRPRASVPKGWDQEGGCRVLVKSAATALSGMAAPAMKAPATTRAMRQV